jgi:hypothetical protein
VPPQPRPRPGQYRPALADDGGNETYLAMGNSFHPYPVGRARGTTSVASKSSAAKRDLPRLGARTRPTRESHQYLPGPGRVQRVRISIIPVRPGHPAKDLRKKPAGTIFLGIISADPICEKPCPRSGHGDLSVVSVEEESTGGRSSKKNARIFAYAGIGEATARGRIFSQSCNGIQLPRVQLVAVCQHKSNGRLP